MAVSDNLQLLFRIKGDDAGAIRALKNVEDKVGNLRGVAGAAASGDIGGLTESLAGLAAGAGPVGVAMAATAAAITAAAAGAAVATKTLFDFAVAAGEAGSKIYDASVQTGLGAETLSTLKVNAEQADVEFGKISQSMTKFSLLVGQAADGSQDAEAKLKKLGTSSSEAMSDLDGSLAKVIKTIAALPPGIEQTNAAAAAFGSKGGKDMLKLIDQLDGDLAKATEAAKQMGLTLSDEAARAADQFSDRLNVLGQRFEMIKTKIGLAVMPAFERFFGGLETWLDANQRSVEAWGQTFNLILNDIMDAVGSTQSWLDKNPLVVQLAIPLLGGAIGAYIQSKFDEAMQQVNAEANVERSTGDVAYDPVTRQQINPRTGRPVSGRFTGDGAGAGKKGSGSGKGESQAIADEQKKIDLAKQRLLVAFQDAMDAVAAVLETGIGDEDLEGAIQQGRDAINTYYDELAKEIENAKLNKLKKAKTEQEKKNIEEEAALESVQLERDRQKAIEAVETDGRVAIVKLRQEASDSIIADSKRATDELLADLKRRFGKGEISEKQYLVAVEEARRKHLLTERDQAQKVSEGVLATVEERKDAAEKIKQIDSELRLLQIENVDALRVAEENEAEAFRKAEEERRKKAEEEKKKQLEATFYGQLGPSKMVVFDEENMTGQLEVLKNFKEMGLGMLNEMAQGIGNLLQQWILTGEIGPNAMRKLTASILAGLAAQAAVEALMELARGFAALANPLTAWRAPFHFKAAAIFGAVAGVAAVAGRAIAGDSFKEQSSRADGSSGSSNRSTSGQGMAYSGQGNQTVDGSRQTGAFRPELVISDRSGMFSQLFEAEIRNNSKVRGLIIETANA